MQRFAVELDRRVIGVAVRVPGGFKFFASDEKFHGFDGRLFPNARSISRRIAREARRTTSGLDALRFKLGGAGLRPSLEAG